LTLLDQSASFKVRVQRGRRVQIPRIVRWRFRLKPSEVFRTFWYVFQSEDFDFRED